MRPISMRRSENCNGEEPIRHATSKDFIDEGCSPFLSYRVVCNGRLKTLTTDKAESGKYLTAALHRGR